MKDDFDKMEIAKKENNDIECKKIFDRVKSEYSKFNYKEKYEKSQCEALRASIKEYTANVDKIIKNSCDVDPCKLPKTVQMMDSVNNYIAMLNTIYDELKSACEAKNPYESKKLKNKASDIASRCKAQLLEFEQIPACLQDLLDKQDMLTQTIERYCNNMFPCNLNPSELKQAGDEINSLINKWNLKKLKTHDAFEGIRSKYDQQINSADPSCKNRNKEAISEYNSFVSAYISITKYKK